MSTPPLQNLSSSAQAGTDTSATSDRIALAVSKTAAKTPANPTSHPTSHPTPPPPRTWRQWAVSVGGSIAGNVVGWGVSRLYVPSCIQYHDYLLTKIRDPQEREAFSRLSAGLVPFLQETLIPEGFFKSAAESNNANLVFFSELLLYHVMVNLNKDQDGDASIKGALITIINAIEDFTKKNHSVLEISLKNYKDAKTAQERKNAYALLENEFSSLVEELLMKAGLDKKGISQITPFYQDELIDLCKQWLTKQCIDIYDKTYFTPEQKRKNESENPQLLEIAQSITTSYKSSVIGSCHTNSAMLVATCNELVLQDALSHTDKVIFTKRLQEAFDSKGGLAQKLEALIEAPLTTIVYNLLTELTKKCPADEKALTQRIEAYVQTLLSKVSLNRDLVDKIIDYHEKAAAFAQGESELQNLRQEAISKPLPLDRAFEQQLTEKEKQVYMLRQVLDSQEQQMLLEAFRPLVTTLLADIGYKKAKDLPLPELLQEAVFTQLCDHIVPKLLLDTSAKLLYEMHQQKRLASSQDVPATTLVAEAANQMVQRTLLPQYQAYLDSLKAKANSDSERAAISHLSQGLSRYVIDNLDKGCYKSILHHNEQNAAFFSEVIVYHVLVNLNEGQNANDLTSGAFTAIVVAIEDFVKLEHPHLQERYKAYKEASTPDAMQVTHEALSQEFQPLVDMLLHKTGLDKEGIARLTSLKNEALEQSCRAWLTKQCIDIYDTMLASCQEKKLEIGDLENTEALLAIAKAIGASTRPTLTAACHANSTSIVSSINSTIFKETALSLQDQTLLVKSLQQAFSPESRATKTLDRLIDEPLTTILYNILVSVAKKSPSDSQNALKRIEAYVTELVRQMPLDQQLLQQISEYYKKIEPLALQEQELQALKQQAASQPLALSEDLENKIRQKEQEVERLKNALDPNEHEKLLKAFAPQVEKILADIGYENKSSLPLPKPIQDQAFSRVKESILPNLLLDTYAKLLHARRELTRESRERDIHVQNLKNRFGNDALVQTARPFAQMLIKIMESLAHLEAENAAFSSVEKAASSLMEKSTEHRVLARLVLEHKGALAEWVKQSGLNGITTSQEKFGKVFEDELEAFIVHTLDTVTQNIEKLEKDDPKRTFSFVVELLQHLTQHLEVINHATKQQKQTHMYTVDPLVMLRQFEKSGILDPAMTGSELIVTIDNLEQRIKQLEAQIGRKEGNIQEAKRRLEESLMSRDALIEHAQKKTYDNFYKGFIRYILPLAGITKPEDLPGTPEMRHAMFTLLQSDVGASVCAEVVATAFEPMMLDKFLRIALETINKELKSPYENEPIGKHLSDEDRLMVDTLKKLLVQARDALPGTLFGTLHKIDELQQLPADIVAHAVRKTFHNYSMNKLIEFSLIKGAQATQEILDEPLPKTPAEQEAMQEQKLERNKRDIKKYHKEAGETVYNGAEKIKDIVVTKWNTFQEWLNIKVPELFGNTGRFIKRILDPILHVLVIDCVVRPLFAIFNLGMTLFYWIYSKMVINHAEHFRKCVTDTPIHANFGFAAVRLMQKHYAVG